MTMEPSRKETKIKQKKSISKLLLPNKTPNKVGVAVPRNNSANRKGNSKLESTDVTKSPLAISKRPLSLDVQSLNSPKKEKHLIVADVCIFHLTRAVLQRNIL